LLIYYVLALVPFALAGYVLWAYHRKAAEKQALSEERMAMLMGETQLEILQHNTPSATTQAVAPAASAAAPGVAPASAAPATAPAPDKGATGKAATWARRERFLSRSEAVVFYLLKTALRRDHEIYVHVTLASVVSVAGNVPSFERDQRERRLAQHELTFVVCDKALHVIAALELEEVLTDVDADFRAECLESAGIRLIKLDPAALPSREEIRALVYGI